MTRKHHPYEIVPCLYDVNTVEYAVRNKFTGYIVAEGCRSMKEAEEELEAYRNEMHRFNDGPFSTAQATAK